MVNAAGLLRVEQSMEESAVETVVAAFADDPGFRKLRLPERTMRRMYALQVGIGLYNGEVYATSDEAEGVMVVQRGEQASFGMREIFQIGSIGTVLGLARAFLNRHIRSIFTTLERDRKKLDIGPYLYLSLLAVAPEHQGNGHGGRLLRYLCERAESEQRAIYLETQTESNVRLYEHFGFTVIKHVAITEGMEMWEMVRSL